MAGNTLRRLTAAAVLAACAPSGFAQTDPVERAKAQRVIADQRAEATVNEEIEQADKLARARRPDVAVKRLKQLIFSLDASAEVSSEKRAELVKTLQHKIDVIEGRATAPALDPKLAKQKEDAKKALEAALVEAKEVRDGLTEVERLATLGRAVDADRKAADLARKYPNNPSVLVLAGQGTFREKVAAAKELAREQADRVAFALNDVSNSALPPKRDLEFDKDYARRMEARRKLEPELIGPEEKAILEALEKKVAKGVKGAPFEETLQNLSNLINKPIYLDKKSLEDAGLDMMRPVTIPDDVTARTALRAVLQAQGLTFVIKDKVIQVVTLEKARENLVTRAYYIGDVTANGPFSGGATWGPGIDFQQHLSNAQVIVDAISKSIDPMIWKERGGPASITYHPLSGALIVRAPAEVHSSLGAALKR
jgi:hypothetical protein